MSKRQGQIPQILIRWAALTILFAGILFLAAGSLHILTLNAYILTLSPSLLIMMLSIAPQIAQESGHPDNNTNDVKARFLLIALFVATIVTAALDVGQLYLLNKVPIAISITALLVFFMASIFLAWAMSVNTFYSPVIQIQAERGHSVVTCGPYRIVRHPAYFAMIILVFASAIAIGSWLALLPAAGFFAVTAWRARKEDTFLERNLPGYTNYMQQVRGGLLPRLRFKP